MQKVYVRGKPTIKAQMEERNKILHFSLQDALPLGHTLALNTTFGTLSYLVSDDNHPRLLMQEQFTSTELSVLLPLFEMFPYYCPYETMYAYFYNRKLPPALAEGAGAGELGSGDATGAGSFIARAAQTARLRHRHLLHYGHRLYPAHRHRRAAHRQRVIIKQKTIITVPQGSCNRRQARALSFCSHF